MKGVLVEIAGAWRTVPWMLYEEEGLANAIAFVVMSPLLVPLAAVVYYSMDPETREILDESEAWL